MKKSILTGLLGILCVNVMAQNDMDAIRYTNKKFGSTAKSMSIAGATGALGADISSASVNPASLAQYRKGEFSFSVGFVNSKNTSRFMGNSLSDNAFKMNVPNLGLVFANKTLSKKGEKGWKNSTVAFNMARVADFNRVINFEGFNTETSLMDYFAERATGFTKDQIRATDDEFDNGFNTKTTMAWEGYLFNETGSRTYAANTNPLLRNMSQKGIMQQSGGMNEYNFSVAGNYSDLLYIGATLNYTNVKFKETKSHSETDFSSNTDSFGIDNFTFSDQLKTNGGGFSGRLGMVMRVSDYLRVGASLQTPMVLKLTDNYSFDLVSTINNGSSFDLNSKNGTYDYTLLTPARYTVSATGIFGKRGFLSADVEAVDYSAMRLRSGSGITNTAMEVANDDIRKKYTSTYNIRIGGELVSDNFRFRGGYASYGSPLKDNSGGNLRSEYVTGGIGIKEENWALDFALVHTLGNDIFQPYVLNDKSKSQAYADNKFTSNTVVITLSTKF